MCFFNHYFLKFFDNIQSIQSHLNIRRVLSVTMKLILVCFFFIFVKCWTQGLTQTMGLRAEEFYLDYNAKIINFTKFSNFTTFKLSKLFNYQKTTEIVFCNSKLNPEEISKLNALQELTNIQLDRNNMCCEFDFNYIIECQQLKSLYLDNNKFRYIRNSSPDGEMFFNLHTIDLSVNNIEAISVLTFQNMPYLTFISLAYNKLTKIDNYLITRPNVLPFIEVIRVDGNFFECDEIKSMLRYGDRENVSISWLPPYSHVPYCLNEFTTAWCFTTDSLCCIDPEKQINKTKIDSEKEVNKTTIDQVNETTMDPEKQISKNIVNTKLQVRSVLTPNPSVSNDIGQEKKLENVIWVVNIMIILLICLIVLTIFFIIHIMYKPVDHATTRITNRSLLKLVD